MRSLTVVGRGHRLEEAQEGGWGALGRPGGHKRDTAPGGAAGSITASTTSMGGADKQVGRLCGTVGTCVPRDG